MLKKKFLSAFSSTFPVHGNSGWQLTGFSAAEMNKSLKVSTDQEENFKLDVFTKKQEKMELLNQLFHYNWESVIPLYFLLSSVSYVVICTHCFYFFWLLHMLLPYLLFNLFLFPLASSLLPLLSLSVFIFYPFLIASKAYRMLKLYLIPSEPVAC